MANTAISTSGSSWGNELLRIYDRPKLFEPMERYSTPVWNMFQEADDVEPRGSGLYFRVVLHTAQRIGTPAESGDLPTGGVRQTLQCSVTGVQVASSFKISEKILNAAKGDGSFGGDALHDAVVEGAQNLYSHIERLLVVSDGNGILATVGTTASTSSTLVCGNPLRTFCLRAGMVVDIVDTSGVVQVTGAGITNVDDPTATLTFDTTVNATAGWYICISGYYGSAPYGLYGIVDDGNVMASFFGQSRGTYPRLNSVVEGDFNTQLDWSEAKLRKLVHRIEREVSARPDVILSNQGVISAHLDKTIQDRQYMVSGKSVPSYGIGYDEGQLFFQYHSNKIPFQVVNDLPARTQLVLSKRTFKKHTLRKPGWLGGPNDVLMLTPSANGGNFELTYTAGMVADLNISCRNPLANGAYRGVKDAELAGDA